MDNPLHVLMTETSPEVCHLCETSWPIHNINLSVCARNGISAFEELLELHPDAVILDVFMPGMDAISLKKKFDETHKENSVQFYAMGTFQSEEIEREMMDSGFLFYLLKPFDVTALADRMLRKKNANIPSLSFESLEDETMVTEMLRNIGVPAHIKGYRFLRESVLRTVDDPAAINAVTKVLYPDIAIAYQTTSSRVERAIRHAIEVAWDRGDIDTLNYYFGSTIHASRGKPTNSEFIAMLADRVLMAKKRNA